MGPALDLRARMGDLSAFGTKGDLLPILSPYGSAALMKMAVRSPEGLLRKACAWHLDLM